MTKFWFCDEPVDLTPYDAVEVHAISIYTLEDKFGVEVGCDVETIDEKLIGSNPHAVYAWSVYLHYNPALSNNRGLNCVADCPTKADAYQYADALEARLRDAIGDALIPMHTEAS
jgi:hypothetical protein